MELVLAFVAGATAGIAGRGLWDRAVARWKRIDFDTAKD